MRVTFPRLPDHERAWALVERDDGVVYRLYGGTAGPRLPHDIMHLVVERELRIKDGIWAGIAAGVVFDSMQHVSGRRPPHAAERSKALLHEFREQGLRAELLADLVSCAATLDHDDPGQDQEAGGAEALGAAQCRGGPGGDRRRGPGPAGGSGPLGAAEGGRGAEL